MHVAKYPSFPSQCAGYDKAIFILLPFATLGFSLICQRQHDLMNK
tara:strand:+ start:1215 stop:1349 length:135 start_codon:yes stop_codon:yes gene_type:complete